MKIEEFHGFRTDDGVMHSSREDAERHVREKELRENVMIFASDLRDGLRETGDSAWLSHDDRGNAVIFLENEGALEAFLMAHCDELRTLFAG